MIPTNEIIFSHKFVSNILLHSPVKINNNNVTRCSHQKHLGVTLESNFNFNTPIDQQIKKCKKNDRSYQTNFSKSS